MPAPSSTPPEDWRDEMRREMKALMKDSMREMMALLPEPNHVTALGSGSHGARSPPVGVPRDANITNPILFAEGHAMAPLALHTGGDSLPVGQPVAVRAHVLEDEDIQADVHWREDDPIDDGADQTTAEEEYNPFQGIEGLDGYSLTGLGSTLPRQKVMVTPSSRQLSLWRQVRGGRTMDAQIKSDIVEKIYASDPAAKPFIDSEAPMEIPTSSRFQAADGLLRRTQRDMGVIAHALTTGLDDLEGAANHLISATNELEEGPVKDRLLQAHREVTQASTHPLGHALRIIASKFNDIANQRRAALASTTNDQVLAQQIRATPLGFDSLLANSLQPAIQVSSSRRQQDLLMAALRSNSRSARPARRERSRSPVRRPHPGQGQQQTQSSRHGQQPFRTSSRGGPGNRGARGSRGGRGTRPSFSRRS